MPGFSFFSKSGRRELILQGKHNKTIKTTNKNQTKSLGGAFSPKPYPGSVSTSWGVITFGTGPRVVAQAGLAPALLPGP